MFDATKLMGSMLESLGAPSTQQRANAALQGGANTPANPFQAMLASLGGGQGAGAGDMLGNIGELAKRAFGGTAQEVRGNNPVAVGGLGAMAGALLGGGRGALGGGLLAALGSLAYAALQSAGQTPAAAPPSTEAEVQDTALLMVRGMIEAAKADGHVDETEARRILERLEQADADAEARAWVQAQLGAPADLAGLAAAVRSPEQAVQVYAAALMAIEVDTAAERDFLARLAAAMQLPAEVPAQIHRSLGIAA